MANTIQIRRGTSADVVTSGGSATSVNQGEPIVYLPSGGNAKLYIGQSSTAGDVAWVGAPISNSSSASSATQLMTASAIQDAIDTEDTIAEMNDTTISSAANGHLLIYDNDSGVWENKEMTGPFDISKDGAVTVVDNAITADMLAHTAVTAGSYTNTDITVDAQGRITAASSGSSGTASTITISANNSTDETVYPIFVDGATGSQGLESDTGLTYNPSDGVLTATGFSGAGTALSGTGASFTAGAVVASANNSTDETVYPTFVDGATGSQGIETDTGFTYNPSSGVITATQFTGAVSGNATTATTATNATHVVLTDNESTNENNAIPFGEGATYTGNVGLETDGDFHYNPSTGSVTATTFVGALTGNASGSAGTVTSIGNLTGDVTSSNRATTIAAAAVHHSMLNDDIISGQDALTSGLASTDELMIDDDGTVKRMDVSVLQSYLQSNLTFTTNTDADVSEANLKTRLAGLDSSDTLYIGDADDDTTVVIRGTLQVDGATTTVSSSTMTVADKNIVLAQGAGNDAAADGAGITIDGADATMLYEATGDQFEFNKEVNCTSGFVGALTGNVTGDLTGTASTATNATNVAVSANNSTDETVYPIFVDGATGNQGAETDTGFTYNPSSGVITATQFTGAVSGNATTATTATTATNVTVSANNSTDETVYPLFVDGATGGQGAETDTGFTYNPSSGVITATQFTGAVSGNATTATTATVATTVTITDNESTNEDNALIFTAGGDTDGGNLGLESDGTCTYNPSTGKITATGFIGTLTGNVTGNASGSSGSCTGNAATATALATGRTIALTGDVTYTSGSFDGSGNVTGTATIAADAVHGTMLNTDSCDTSTIELSSDTLSVLKVPNALTVDNTTIGLNSGTTYDGAGARTISAKTAAIADGGAALATADQIHTFVTGVTIDGGAI